jgi:Flp pilus assembly protein TadG
MTLFRRNLRRDEKGAAAVEFAFVAPVVIMMILGTIEGGRLMFLLNDMQASLSAAARAWMIDPDASESDVEGIFCERAVVVDCDETTITVTSQTANGQDWRVMTATTTFSSPLSHLLPLPSELTRTHRVPIYES